MRLNGGVIARRSSWPEHSTSIGRKELFHGYSGTRARTVWNGPAPRCRASGAGDGWHRTPDLCEAVGGWVWKQLASHRTVEPEYSPVLWQGVRCNNPASRARGLWREHGMHHWWAFNGSFVADVFGSTAYLSAWSRAARLKDGSRTTPRLRTVLDGRMEVPLTRIDPNTLGQTTSRTEPDEFGFRRVELESVVRHPLPDTTDAVDKPGCEAVHVVNEAVVVDLHVIGVSVNGEAVLISDTEYICCEKTK